MSKKTFTAVAAFASGAVLAVSAFALGAGAGAAPAPGTPVVPYPTTTGQPVTEAPSSSSAPSSSAPGGTTSGTLAPGATVTISGGGATPNGTVNAILVISDGGSGFVGAAEIKGLPAAKAQTVNLGSTTADGSGNWSITVTLPNFSGAASLVVTDAATGTTLFSAGVPAGGGSGGGSTGGGTTNEPVTAGTNGGGSTGVTASTGVAVVGIGVLGVALLAGGGLMLLAGSRRKANA